MLYYWQSIATVNIFYFKCNTLIEVHAAKLLLIFSITPYEGMNLAKVNYCDSKARC